MTRSWTDPRTGKRWHIDAVSSRSAKRAVPGRARTPGALVFESSEVSYEVPTSDAARLEALEDDLLAALLDEAKDNRGRS
jgi:hypothetical protein